MRLFKPLYERVLRWANKPAAVYYLALLSFCEASFFPIPPDVLLAPMALVKSRRAMSYASITTISSVLGGLFGYLIGWFALSYVLPFIEYLGYLPAYEKASTWFIEWGFWALFLAGITPIPFKIATVAAGALHMAVLPFIVASLIGRGLRFFLLAGVIAIGGAPIEQRLRQHIEVIGWLVIGALVIGFAVYRFYF